jgi:hypothetical protein
VQFLLRSSTALLCRAGFWLGVLCLLAASLLHSEPAQAKRRASAHPPELRIVNVTVDPTPYSPVAGTLQLTVEVELPSDLALNTILEVSSLISSPSKRSMRFLVNRQPLDLATLTRAASTSSSSRGSSASASEGRPRLEVTLVWDGTDQSNQYVSEGRYDYEIRTKLLLASEEGPPRTQMVSWPKRGTVVIGEPLDVTR